MGKKLVLLALIAGFAAIAVFAWQRYQESVKEEERKAHDRDVTELRNRLAALEKKANSSTRNVKEKPRKGNIIRDLTVLVAIAAAAWVIVTLVNKLL